MDSDVISIDEDHDATLPHGLKIQRALERNVALRASTSLDSIQSYEIIKAEKHFQNDLNVRHINNARFTRLLRFGTNVCCYFQDSIG